MEFENMLDQLRQKSGEITSFSTPRLITEKLKQEISNCLSILNSARSQAMVNACMSRLLFGDAMRQALTFSAYSKSDQQMYINYVREALAPLYKNSGIWSHSLNKPKGYAGDYIILEHIYDTNLHPNTQSSLGEKLDYWAYQSTLAKAVTARKDALVYLIQDLVRHHDSDRPFRLLSLASGSARELRELPIEFLNKLEITLLDNDEASLEFASTLINAYSPNLKVKTIKANALKGPGTLDTQLDQRFDLIYSFGLFDYLPDSKLLDCASRFLGFLSEEGHFVFCLKDTRYYKPWIYEWLYDWVFYPRTFEDGHELIHLLNLRCKESFKVEHETVCIYVCGKQPRLAIS